MLKQEFQDSKGVLSMNLSIGPQFTEKWPTKRYHSIQLSGKQRSFVGLNKREGTKAFSL